MRTFILGLALATISTVAAAEAVTPAAQGKAIFGAQGKRIGAIYRVTETGAVQVILNGKMVNIPGSTVSVNNGKVETTLSKSELLSSR